MKGGKIENPSRKSSASFRGYCDASRRMPRIISQVSFDKLAPGIRYPRFTLVLSITTTAASPPGWKVRFPSRRREETSFPFFLLLPPLQRYRASDNREYTPLHKSLTIRRAEREREREILQFLYIFMVNCYICVFEIILIYLLYFIYIYYIYLFIIFLYIYYI